MSQEMLISLLNLIISQFILLLVPLLVLLFSSACSDLPSCFSPWWTAPVFANFLRSYFSLSHPKAWNSTAVGYFSEICMASCPKESHSSFSPPKNNLAAAANRSSFTATGLHRVAYPHAETSSLLWHVSSSLL